jgi:(2Fe-2S) ferredoxin
LSNFGLLFLCNKATALVFSDKKVWYNELTAESASQNHPPHAASAAVLKDHHEILGKNTAPGSNV